MALSFFDLLGVADASDPAGDAAARWPTIPASVAGSDGTLADVAQYVQDALEIKEFRPGADAERVGFSAEVHVTPPAGTEQALRFPRLPDLRFFLQPTTEEAPARLFVTQDSTGVEWVIESLPVEIRLPAAMVEPPAGETVPDDVTWPEDGYSFTQDRLDDLKVVLRHTEPSSIFVRIKVRRTREGELVFEPAVPISIGPCTFLGLPCRGLHDLSFLPSSTLGGAHSDRELPIEWARHTLDPLHTNPGQLTVRTVDLDTSKRPLDQLVAAMNDGRHTDIELVLEDIALPMVTAVGILPPLPTHGRVGIRHSQVDSTDPATLAEYDLNASPLRIRLGSWFLLVEELYLQTPAPPAYQPINVKLAFAEAGATPRPLTDDGPHDEARGTAFTFAVLDDWTLQLGVRAAGQYDPPTHTDHPTEREAPTDEGDTDVTVDEHGGTDGDTTTSTSPYTPPGWVLFEMPALKLAISALALKGGISIQRATDGQHDWPETFQILVDLGVFGTEASTTSTSNVGDTTPFRIDTQTHRPLSIVLRDIGWDLGEPSLSGVSFPDGTELRAFEVLRLIVDDLGWVAENNGGYYFFFSGGIAFDFGGGSPSESSEHEDEHEHEHEESSSSSSGGGTRFGITFDRLRFKIGGSASAPAFLLDGVAIDLRVGTFALRGFGMYHDRQMTDEEGDDFQLQEFGIGLQIAFNACAVDFKIGAEFFYGTIKYLEAEHADRNFTYWLAGAQLSPIPIGPYQLINIRALVASNLDPNAEDNPEAPNMRLLRWYLENEEALTLPADRQFGSIWKRVDHSLSVGVGAGLSFPGGNSVKLDLFVFYHDSPEERGLLALLRLYLLRSEEPCAFGALELDLAHDTWAFMIGLDLDIAKLLGVTSDVLKFIKLTGTLYGTNKPAMLALGHLNDQDSWLSLLVRIDLEHVLVIKFQIGICVELADGGPNGFGFVVAAQAAIDLAILEIEAYLTLGVLAGSWRSESSACGCLVWFESGLRIRLLFIFTFGISARLEYDTLRSSPGYAKLSGDFQLETPWFLPDITFHYEQIWDEPHPEKIENVQPPVGGASAMTPGSQRMVPLPVTPLPGDIYSIEQLRGAGTPDFEGAPDAEPIGVDSTIALDFKPSIDDLRSKGTNTPLGASTEPIEKHSTELTLTYELVSMEIRRRPRFGPGAGGAWSALESAVDTELFDPRHPDVPNTHATLTQTVTTQWDGDSLSAGRTDPRRLLINADTPFTLVTRNDAADEAHAREESGWPCNPGDTTPGRATHVLTFAGTASGTRAPARQAFSASTSRLAWPGRPPVVGPSQYSSTHAHAARVEIHTDGTLATVAFDQSVLELTMVAAWPQAKGTVSLVGYRGVTKVVERDLAIASGPASVTLSSPTGFTSLVIRGTGTHAGFELISLSYVGLREENLRLARERRSAARRDDLLSGDGKLAWLANHEYEVAVTVRVSSSMDRTATTPQTVLVEQKAKFATKGLLGLNAVARTGDEVQPYVESTYPARGLPVYTSEPIALALSPGMNILAPLARTPSPDDPDERGQILEWALTVEQTSGNGEQRVSQTGSDWIAAHRTAPEMIALGHVLDADLLARLWRNAPTIDPFRLRLERLITSPGGCAAGDAPRLERSQLLVHQPMDADGNPRWKPGAQFRAIVRRDGGPCVDRTQFEAADATALAWARDTGDASPWNVEDGALVAPGADVRSYALFGELDWNHVTVRANVAPAPGAEAGIALAVNGTSVDQALIAVLAAPAADVPPQLKLFARTGGVTRELVAGIALAAVATSYELEVIAFDDRVRVRCGEAVVEAERGELRDGKLALVATGASRIAALSVEPLDAYAFTFTASRFESFEDHIASCRVSVLPADGPQGAAARTTVAAMFTPERLAKIATLAAPDGNADARQATFDACVRDLALPLREKLTRVELTRLVRDGQTELLILESPEPLPLGYDVTCVLLDAHGTTIPLAILPDGLRRKALLVPSAALPEGAYRLAFHLDRARYRGDGDGARYVASATVAFGGLELPTPAVTVPIPVVPTPIPVRPVPLRPAPRVIPLPFPRPFTPKKP